MSLEASDTWKSLPHKDQLAVLTLCRAIDFFQIVSFQTICYYQLKSFDPSATEQVLSWQTGVALASFTASQSCTAIPWGYVADAKWGGRKNVLLIGLMGTSLSCIGVAFSTSFASVVVFRAIGGAMNGTVGVIRTMMSEVIRHKRHQSRAFLLLPASFSIAALISPVFTGWLSDPASTYPNRFGHIEWLRRYTHSLPSLLSALLLMVTSIAVLLTLRETLESYDPKLQSAALLRAWNGIIRSVGRMNGRGYSPLASEEPCDTRYDRTRLYEKESSKLPCPESKPPFRHIWTRNVVLTMISLAFFEFHLGAFGSAWPLLLSGTRESSAGVDDLHQSLKGGLGLSPQNLGYTMAFAGLAGLLLQFLFYPAVHKQWGTLKCYRLFSLLFPIVYVTSPFLLVMAGSSATPIEAFTWIFILILLFIHSTSRIFCVPASIMLLNNCSPHPSVLGIVHGIGQATAAGFRTLGPVCAGYLHGIAIANDTIGLSLWVTSATAILAWLVSLVIREGSGHEIALLSEDDSYDGEIKSTERDKV
ncbi:major facilitator superfamily domain-containing protein [Xylaria bambusicola]|uniref:major facilitator superfamily domain-containing protein n=1 Tax=Xylaria bambusicola TaxID=326684 RepID=UPI0020074B47|nr:major facilitator superfamily domain-containing protein [Xylaria bambusicola]KAI0509602.1 major facilitator superfamily domain-containing protein [Xylaria bambusicola]